MITAPSFAKINLGLKIDPRRPDGLPAWMGSLKGQISYGPDFDKSDAEIQKLFDESKIFPWDDEGP